MHKYIFTAIAMALLSPILLVAQKAEEIIPIDKSIRIGKLTNGFTYYIKKNTKPEKRVFMYLANKVGSILENDSQQGLAHFMEHMSFNGTKHFPKNELINYLQKSGVRFGADLNAYTSFDETVYQLPLASDNPELIKNGLQILRDWAQDATLEQSEIDAERGVVLEEKRLRLGSAERINKKIFPLLVNNAKYASRSPIGEEAVLKNFTRDTLLAFYEDWYRPDLQAIVIVGDIDVNKMETAVKSMFSDLKMPKNVKVKQSCSIPLINKNQFALFTDKDVSESSVQIIIKSRLGNINTKSGYRQILMRSIFNQLVGKRLAELSQKSFLPFLRASASFETVLADLQAFNVDIKIKNNDYENGVKAVWGLLQNIKQNGFTNSEIERARTSLLAFIQSQIAEKNKSNSEELVQEYVRNFLTGEPVPGIALEYSMIKDFFSDLKTEDFNTFASSCIGNTNRDIYITAPEKEINNLPDEATMENWLLQASQKSTVASNKEEIIKPLLTKTIKSGAIISEKKNKITGVTEWLLSNGATVILKPTKFANSEILFSAASAGGASLLADSQYAAVMLATDIVPASGVGDYNSLPAYRLLMIMMKVFLVALLQRMLNLRCNSSIFLSRIQELTPMF
jgi:zinc protease